jgi:hypothetical protein
VIIFFSAIYTPDPPVQTSFAPKINPAYLPWNPDGIDRSPAFKGSSDLTDWSRRNSGENLDTVNIFSDKGNTSMYSIGPVLIDSTSRETTEGHTTVPSTEHTTTTSVVNVTMVTVERLTSQATTSQTTEPVTAGSMEPATVLTTKSFTADTIKPIDVHTTEVLTTHAESTASEVTPAVVHSAVTAEVTPAVIHSAATAEVTPAVIHSAATEESTAASSHSTSADHSTHELPTTLGNVTTVAPPVTTTANGTSDNSTVGPEG